MSSPSTPSSPVRALVVEDSPINQKVLTRLLENEKCVVTHAADGQQALDRLAEEEFDVVLMDVQMPVMDGLAATRQIREREANSGKRTPILAVTAGGDRDSCLQAGMDDFLAKPVRPESLREKLEGLLGEWPSQRD